MTSHLEQELENIKSTIFEMADLAIESIVKSVESIKNSDIESAKVIIENDNILDQLEIDLDDSCIKFLVTRQPAATDLRLILAMLKINTDLERIGDLASNIAKTTIKIDGKPLIKPLIDIPRMADLCVSMIKDALDAITDKDVDKATQVIESDSIIDDLNIQIYRELFSFMVEDPRTISQSLELIMVSKALERIGDHATNIAERAVYYIEGVDIRHADGLSE